MTQIEFLRLWVRIKPAQVKRRAWHHLGMQVHTAISNTAFAFREPRCWWFCRRVSWHYRYGFPMPPMPPKSPFAIEA